MRSPGLLRCLLPVQCRRALRAENVRWTGPQQLGGPCTTDAECGDGPVHVRSEGKCTNPFGAECVPAPDPKSRSDLLLAPHVHGVCKIQRDIVLARISTGGVADPVCGMGTALAGANR